MSRLFPFLVLQIFLIFIQSSASADSSSYMRNFRNVEARFLQKNPDGSVSGGVVFFVSHGKFRVDYFEPNEIVLILNGNVITYYDRDLDETSHKVLKKSSSIVRFFDKLKKKVSADASRNNAAKNSGSDLRFSDYVGDDVFTVVFDTKSSVLRSLVIEHVDKSKTSLQFYDFKYDVKFSNNLLTEF